jgi:hypothetical protein
MPRIPAYRNGGEAAAADEADGADSDGGDSEAEAAP